MNGPWIYMYSPSWSPLHPPSLPHPSGSSQCTSPEHLCHASNLSWWSVSHLITYMFRCCSPKTSHPHLLPQSPKFCSVHLFSTHFELLFSSVQSLSHVRLFATPWITAHQASLSINHLSEFTLTHVHRVGDAIQPSHPLTSPSPPALNLSQHQCLSQWVSSSHQVAKGLEFKLHHQSFQWTPMTDVL